MPRTEAGGGQHRIVQGDRLDLETISSIAVIVVATARVVYDDGTTDYLRIPEKTLSASRVQEDWASDNIARADGWVFDGVVLVQGSAAGKRGQTYVRLTVGPTAGGVLCMGYLYSIHVVAQGQYDEPGPGGGEGFLFFQTVGFDIAGNVTTTYTPAVTNTFRKLYGVIMYYNADGNAANRVPTIRAFGPWGALPTGMATANTNMIFNQSGPTLSLSEEGLVMVYTPPGRGDGYIVANDNSVLTTSSTATVPSPFPFLLREDDPMTIDFLATSGLAGDVYAAYALVEEWLVI